MNASAGNAPAIHARVCDFLGFPGVRLDENRSAAGEPLISADQGHVKVRVTRKGEDVMIPRAVFRMLANTQTSPARHLPGVTL
jgi:acetate kinase